jgi:L-asparaginase
VVTQGTDSLEEAAYALDLLWDRDAPLVVTGAMRPPAAAGADGPANLLAAVTVAVARASEGRGVLVVLADEIHAARAVAKVHATRPAAFASPGGGPAGSVSEGRVAFAAPPRPRAAALAVGVSARGVDGPDVALVTAVLGDRGTTLRAVAAAGVDGIVLAAMGAGHVPALLLPALEEAVAAIPVAAASRTGAGRLLRATYAFTGSEADLWRLGVLDAGDLAPLKARVLLTLALRASPDRATAEALFAERAAV